MSRFWENNRRFLQIVGGGVLLFVILQIAVVNTLASRREVYDKKHQKRSEESSDHRKGDEAINRRIEYLHQRNKELLKNRKELMEALEVKFKGGDPTKVPAGLLPADYFRIKLAEVAIKHEQLYLNDGVKIEDEHLGFNPADIAALTPKQALENLKKLAMIDKLLMLLRQAEVSRIITVQPEDIRETGALRPESRRFQFAGRLIDKYPPFIREIPVQIVVVGPVDSLMRFLHSVRRKNDFLMIRNIVIHNRHAKGLKATGEYAKMQADELRVTITAAGMSFLTEEEIEEQKADQPKSGPVRILKHLTGPVPPVGPYQHNRP